jgi:hypothetical protein
MSLVKSQQPRQTGGVPEGGQFARKTNTPPEGLLTESATGSFAFPPRTFASVEEYIEFFEAAPISDRILSNADHAYRQWRQDGIDEEVRAAYHVYGNDPKILAAADKNIITSDRHARQFVAEVRAEAEARRPIQFIEPHLLRNVLRAHQMWFFSATAPGDSGQDAVRGHRLLGGQWTVQEIVDGSSTQEWASRALTDSDLAAVDAMRRVVSTLDEHAGF